MITMTLCCWSWAGVTEKPSHVALRQGNGHLRRLAHFLTFCDAYGKNSTGQTKS
jgi:hypothetical protein